MNCLSKKSVASNEVEQHLNSTVMTLNNHLYDTGMSNMNKHTIVPVLNIEED
jgi:hypothetical protein